MEEIDFIIKMGCKKWTGGSQLGLRIYTPSINRLIPLLDTPSDDGVWNNLGEFIQKVNRGISAKAYSKKILVLSRSQKGTPTTMTIARHGTTTQGYITAPQDTWFYGFVNHNIGEDFDFEYIPSPKGDILVIPETPRGIVKEIEQINKSIKNRIDKYCLKHHFSPPPKAKEIGLFYEIKEKEYLEKLGFKVYHRYPYIFTNRSTLIGRGISCDIDVFNNKGNFVKFVEVKSIAAIPGTEFRLTVNEYESRNKCIKNGWQYEIVVYYHFRDTVIKRQVIKLFDKLKFKASGYLCYQ